MHVVAGYAWLLSWGTTTWSAWEGRVAFNPSRSIVGTSTREIEWVHAARVLVMYQHVLEIGWVVIQDWSHLVWIWPAIYYLLTFGWCNKCMWASSTHIAWRYLFTYYVPIILSSCLPQSIRSLVGFNVF
jgi:hypothetical protein